MADGFVLEIDAEMAERLKAAAEAAGVAPEAYALDVLKGALDQDWVEDLRRLAEYERTGDSVSVEEAMAHFDAAIGGGPPSAK
jgi:hypothetical protein